MKMDLIFKDHRYEDRLLSIPVEIGDSDYEKSDMVNLDPNACIPVPCKCKNGSVAKQNEVKVDVDIDIEDSLYKDKILSIPDFSKVLSTPIKIEVAK